MSAHLGDRVSALADGQLPPGEAERALAHVACCPLCSAELESARAARRRLASAADVHPTAELTQRLLDLSASIPPADGDPLRAPERDTGWAAPEAWHTTLTGDVVGAERRRRRRRALLVGAGGAGVLGCALFVLGQAPVVTPDTSRVSALTTLAGSDAAAGEPVSEAGLGGTGFATPSSLPPGYEVAAVRAGATSCVIDLTGPDGPVVVRQQVGRLAEQTGASVRAGEAGRDDVVVLSRDPWHVAWQAGDVVVEVTTDAPEDVLAEIVAAFPERDYDAGVLPQITRGWSTVTGALTLP
ncbi:zf-HC2 domain-containing protein [Isoptericola sp. b408]|uniref:zf-HC2 domain-containing protein n=1 Tax=Isoptericola sp. b408 TaxID=3064653 RepID=UPI0027139D30|nr:zf-HC2 domain-containing protein [Isoptericola sp. b408]MDO8151661.1 zf-HC2 domain-containing protein [Isoptericola sp. b408]